jgi:hypothetical protein
MVPPEQIEDEEGNVEPGPVQRRSVELGAVTKEYRGADVNRYLESGEALTIRLNFEVTEEIEDVSFGITIVSDRGDIMFSEVRHAIYGGGTFAPGFGEIEFVFDEITFLDGRFTVNIDVRDSKGLVIDAAEPACEFEVMYPGRAVGFVSLPFHLELVAPTERDGPEIP